MEFLLFVRKGERQEIETEVGFGVFFTSSKFGSEG
jgi:hypothetical protein